MISTVGDITANNAWFQRRISRWIQFWCAIGVLLFFSNISIEGRYRVRIISSLNQNLFILAWQKWTSLNQFFFRSHGTMLSRWGVKYRKLCINWSDFAWNWEDMNSNEWYNNLKNMYFLNTKWIYDLEPCKATTKNSELIVLFFFRKMMQLDGFFSYICVFPRLMRSTKTGFIA